ncbi:MAG: CotH kinase family protein [Mogibacterium sp.]|nr:CotH kinase family protein [Mogibacterium sp.]
MKKTLALVLIWIMALAMLPVTAFADGEDPIAPKNGIPLVIIRLDEEEFTDKDGNEYGTIADMNNDKDHKIRCKGTIEFVVPDGFVSEFEGDVPEGELALSFIRGRGNSTWGGAKKPYKIKLAKREDVPDDPGPDLFGMGESREWALMANARDETLIKNRITGWLGDELGLDYTPRMVPVDVYMVGKDPAKGEYLGSYCLSELVQVEASRINMELPKKSHTSEPEITGGYLLAMYNEMQDSGLPETTVFKTKAGVELINEEPEYVDDELGEGQEAQRAYIKRYIQELEDLIMTPKDKFTEDVHNQIADMMDLQSLADYWFIQEFSNNGDAFVTSSTYLYKPRGDKLYWGPLWDFDMGWGPLDMEMSDDFYESFNRTEMIWIDQLRDKDQWFVDLLEERWDTIKEKLDKLTEDGGIIDQYGAQLAQSQSEDYEIWTEAIGEDAEVAEDYNAVLTNLKGYINKRSEKMGEKIAEGEVGHVYVTATFKAEGETIRTARIRTGNAPGVLDAPDAPAVEGKLFVNWYTEGSDSVYDEEPITEDTVFEARYIDESDAVHPEAVFFTRSETWVPLDQEKFFIDAPAVYPEEATSKAVKYSVSDESIASINGEGVLEMHQLGDVVITARTYNGVEGSYTVHIYDAKETEAIDATGIKAGPDMTMKPGELKQASYTLLPEGRPVKDTYVECTIDDKSVATIDYMGVITALKPGTATITLSIAPDIEGETYTDTLKLTVSDPDDGGESDPEKATYTIKYDLNGGTLDGQTGVITEQHKEGEVITVKDAPTRTGYKFDYWEGSKLYPGDKYTVTEDHTLKAVWTRNTAAGSSSGSRTTSSGTTASKTVASAKTGDHAEFKIWYLLMILSAATMLGVLASGKKRRA